MLRIAFKLINKSMEYLHYQYNGIKPVPKNT